MREKKNLNPNNKDMIKTLFKVQFETGKTYYGITKVKSVKSFITCNVQLAKFHLENPSIHPITTFESLLLNEEFACEIVEVGLDTELAVMKDGLVESDIMCINSKKSVVDKKKLEKNPPITIKKEFIKSVKNAKGEVLNFIDKNFGIKKGLIERMKFGITHPLKTGFCLINAPIQII
jgi:hypothetical protein